ncbi:MAG: histidine kinase [Alphaproteobacteria bacterium]|nr:histidine kinase [Alphaproteobacteria bacterium]
MHSQSPLTDRQVCGSLGQYDNLSDINDATCRPVGGLDEIDTQNRVLWLRGQVDIRADYPRDTPFALYTGALAARDIWWNGERIGQIGRVGASSDAETAGDLDAVTWIPPHLLRTGDNAVDIRYSTFKLPLPVNAPLHYAYADRIFGGRNLLIAYGPVLAVTSALVAAAIFFGCSFFSDRRVLGPLFIALMCLFAVAQLWLESLRGFLSFPYPIQVWRLMGIAILAFGFALSMTAYVAGRFVPKRWLLHVMLAALSGVVMLPIMPGFDGMTLGLILAPSFVSFAAAGQGIAARRQGAIITALALAVFIALQLIGPKTFLDQNFYLSISVLALVLFIDQALDLRRARVTAAEVSQKAAALELELLRRRIAPHFLMNTLNALTEWVESDPKTGVKMIEALADEFRLLSQVADRNLIPLADELALCRRHLDVMSYRTDRAFTLDAAGVDETLEVPPGVLHTLVENAFTHGRFVDGASFRLIQESMPHGVRLILTAPLADSPGCKPNGGRGLAYVRGRLDAAFGADANTESGPTPEGWRTILTFPRARPKPA